MNARKELSLSSPGAEQERKLTIDLSSIFRF
jgi:hypothetical protein